MAYDYSKAYNKRRSELIQTRKALSKMGVPLSTIPALPKKPKTVTKDIAKQMANILRETKDIKKAETFINKHPTITREERLIELERQRERKRERERERYKEKLRRRSIAHTDIGSMAQVLINNFEERLDKIPYFKGRNGKSFFGRDIIKNWWASIQANLYPEQIYELLLDAQEQGLLLEIEKLYNENIASSFVSNMMGIMRNSNYIDSNDYETVNYEINEYNEGSLYED